METYNITFIDTVGQIVVETIQADSLKEAKQICKDYYSVKKFI
jgi:hypothetical protein